MEKGPKQKGGPGMAGALAGVLGLCLLAAILLTGDGERASEAAAPAMVTMPRLSAAASVDTEIGEQVIPLGRAVGIKLFSDGVLVVDVYKRQPSSSMA